MVKGFDLLTPVWIMILPFHFFSNVNLPVVSAQTSAFLSIDFFKLKKTAQKVQTNSTFSVFAIDVLLYKNVSENSCFFYLLFCCTWTRHDQRSSILIQSPQIPFCFVLLLSSH